MKNHCYQAGVTGDWSDVNHEEASEFCKNRMGGTLVSEDTVESLTPFLSGIRPQSKHGVEFEWWIQSLTPETCKTISEDGTALTVNDQDCQGNPSNNKVRQPLCQLGKIFYQL